VYSKHPCYDMLFLGVGTRAAAGSRSNIGFGISGLMSALSSLDTLLYTASIPILRTGDWSAMSCRDVNAILGIIIGMAKIVMALNCLFVPCKT